MVKDAFELSCFLHPSSLTDVLRRVPTFFHAVFKTTTPRLRQKWRCVPCRQIYGAFVPFAVLSNNKNECPPATLRSRNAMLRQDGMEKHIIVYDIITQTQGTYNARKESLPAQPHDQFFLFRKLFQQSLLVRHLKIAEVKPRRYGATRQREVRARRGFGSKPTTGGH